MDKETLKAYIVDCKDSGMTFQEISDELNEKYNIQKTRQAIQKMYQRIKAKEKDEPEKIKITADIVNMYCLGYNMTEIHNNLISSGYNISYMEVNKIVKNNKEYIDRVEKTYTDIAIKNITISGNIDRVGNNIVYKDLKVTDSKLKDYIKNAYSSIIKEKIEYSLAEVYQVTDDRVIVKDVIDNLGLDIQIADILSKV